MVDPTALNEEMVRWVHDSVPQHFGEKMRLSILLEKLLHESSIDLKYETNATTTAIEVFESGKANCLSFTFLLVGLAEEIGIPLEFVRAEALDSYEEEGLVVIENHLTAAYGPPAKRLVLEFTSLPVYQKRILTEVSRQQATALYYSNLGAEAIRGKELEEAEKFMKISLSLDPGSADALVNLGVIQRRQGKSAEAVRSYEKAIEINPGSTSAYQNLALLHFSEGRENEALEVLEWVEENLPGNPYPLISLGDLYLKQGLLDSAEEAYLKARRADRSKAAPLAALGQLELRRDQRKKAERWLKKAHKKEPKNARVLSLAREIFSEPPKGASFAERF